MKVYALMYNPDIYESADGLVSLHKTQKGAVDARKDFIKINLGRKLEDYEDLYTIEFEVID